MSTVDVNLVRKFATQGDINLGPISIREDEPRTPQVRQALKDIQLSSPAANYDLEPMQQSQGPRTYSVQHKTNDRQRLIVRLTFRIDLSFTYFPNLQSTKEAAAKMESRMSAMEAQLRVRLMFCIHLLFTYFPIYRAQRTILPWRYRNLGSN